MQSVAELISNVPSARVYGRVASVQGLLVEVSDSPGTLSVGSRVAVTGTSDKEVLCEVVGFRDGRALCLPYGRLEGVRMGCKAYVDSDAAHVYPSGAWLGRVVNAFGEPVDGKGPIARGAEPFELRAAPPPAHERSRVFGKLDLGVRVINAFTTCSRGQRMGIFAGSGVGKSILLSQLARYTASDVIVIGLIGERGREVQEFLADDLGAEGLKRAVVVVATSDEAALMRRQAAHMTMTVAEYFRDQGLSVLCLIDSVTRFAMAQREIGLSCGEPPASKGYTPTVFAELPRLLERAGPGRNGQGSITGLFTVLVEGDDHNEPIADAVRGILDGHIVLERQIAERGRYPAVNVLKSVSRTMPGCNTEKEQSLVTQARRHLATYNDMEELIRLGAYRVGTDPAVDEAIRLYPELEAFMSQGKTERAPLASVYSGLEQILRGEGKGRTKA